MGHSPVLLLGLAIVFVCAPPQVVAQVRELPKAAAPSHDARLARQLKSRGDTYFAQHRWDDAMEAYLRALAASPTAIDPADRVQIARNLIAMADLVDAIAVLQGVIDEQPDNGPALLELARDLLVQENYEDAKRHAERALKLNSGSALAKRIVAQAADGVMRRERVQQQVTAADRAYAKGDYKTAANGYLDALATPRGGLDATTSGTIAERVAGTLRFTQMTTLVKSTAMAQSSEVAPSLTRARLYFAIAQATARLWELDPSQWAVHLQVRGHDATFPLPSHATRGTRSPQQQIRPQPYNKDRLAWLYVEALTLAPAEFSTTDRLMVVQWLAGTGNHGGARTIAAQLVREEPGNQAARLALAKADVALERYRDALKQVDAVLAMAPHNKQAAMLRANVLYKRRAYRDAIAQFKDILSRGDDAEAQAGLAYALLAAGRSSEARDLLQETGTTAPAPAQALEQARKDISQARVTAADLVVSRYRDSDKNSSVESGVTLRGILGDWLLGGDFRTTHAVSEDAEYRIDVVDASIAGNLTDQLRLFTKAGFVQHVAEEFSPIAIGEIKLDAQSSLLRTVLDVSHEHLTNTASVIDKGITMTQASLALSGALPGRSSMSGRYTRREFSDGNSADRVELSLRAGLHAQAPYLSVGYGYQYMNFLRPAHNGYFDPQDYSAHQGLATLGWDYGPLYLLLDGVIGQQAYSRNGVDQGRESFIYANLTVGAALTRYMTLEFNGEWNNPAAFFSPDKYGESTVGGRLSFTF
jgi:tetratricopeptide (TPR) repeat protein